MKSILMTGCAVAVLAFGLRAQEGLPTEPAQAVDSNTPGYPGGATVQPPPPSSTGEVPPPAQPEPVVRPLPDAKLPAAAEVRAAAEKIAALRLAKADAKADVSQRALLLAGFVALDAVSPATSGREAVLAALKDEEGSFGLAGAELWFVLREPRLIAGARAEADRQIAATKPAAKESPKKSADDKIVAAVGDAAAPARARWENAEALLSEAPVWARLYTATGAKKYRDGLVRRLKETSGLLFDAEASLFHADAQAMASQASVRPRRYSGFANGCAVAGLARVLGQLADNDPARAELEGQFRALAASLASARLDLGGWSAEITAGIFGDAHDPAATALIAAGLASGISQGLLKADAFQPVVAQAWALLAANAAPVAQADGSTVDPQPLPARAAGASLLAGAELYRLALVAGADGFAVVTAENPAQIFRDQQTIEIPWEQVASRARMATLDNVAVLDLNSARILDSQVLDQQGDPTPELLLVQADFLPGQTKRFVIVSGLNRDQQPQPALSTFARFVPERLDDFAWENDRIAYRVYGPALLKEPGETGGSGIDVWCKRVRGLVVDKWYATDDYAEDKGEGCDFYRVGSTRGAGGSGVLIGGKISGGPAFKSWRIHANGPIRTTFELHYDLWNSHTPAQIETNPAVALGADATNELLVAEFNARVAQQLEQEAVAAAANRIFGETKTISLDRGANFNRVTSILTAGTSDGVTFVGGTPMLPGDSRLTKDEQSGWLAYTTPDSAPNGSVHTAILAQNPFAPTVQEAAGHHVVAMTISAGQIVPYHIAAGWTKGLDFPTHEAWVAHVKNYAARIAAPLKVEVR